MAPRRIMGSTGVTMVLGLVLTLAPSTARAQDDEPIDTGWDIMSIDFGDNLTDPSADDSPFATVVLEAPGPQGEPERSPDGTRIAYTSGRGARGLGPHRQVHILEADGTHRRLTHGQPFASQPTWSPDGHRVAFVAKDGIRTIRDDGTNETVLVPRADAGRPDWSADGRFIVFQRGGPDGGEIWTVEVRTGKLRRLSHSEPSPDRCQRRGRMDNASWAELPACLYRSRYPTWSPDGLWIAFLRHEDKPGGWLELEDTDLWLMRADGSEKHRAVTGEDEPVSFPASSPDGHFQGPPMWSPDGRLIAMPEDHCRCLLVVDVESGTTRQVGHAVLELGGGELDWGPDGTILAEWADATSAARRRG